MCFSSFVILFLVNYLRKIIFKRMCNLRIDIGINTSQKTTRWLVSYHVQNKHAVISPQNASSHVTVIAMILHVNHVRASRCLRSKRPTHSNVLVTEKRGDGYKYFQQGKTRVQRGPMLLVWKGTCEQELKSYEILLHFLSTTSVGLLSAAVDFQPQIELTAFLWHVA